MNRTIKFRGLRTDGKWWAYGYYAMRSEFSPVPETNERYCEHYILIDEGFNGFEEVLVKPETVGQFVLTNVEAIDVFEGDTSIDGWEVFFSDKANAFMVRRGDMYKDLGGWFKPNSNIHEQ